MLIEVCFSIQEPLTIALLNKVKLKGTLNYNAEKLLLHIFSRFVAGQLNVLYTTTRLFTILQTKFTTFYQIYQKKVRFSFLKQYLQ